MKFLEDEKVSMKMGIKRCLTALLALVMIATIMPSVPIKSSAASTLTTGDIIEYGSYPQTKVTDESLIAALNACTLSAENTVTYGGSKYKRVYFTLYTQMHTTRPPNTSGGFQPANGYYINTVYWFKYEPIQWRVLSNTNGELFVMSEKIIDTQAYNQVASSVTWETCTLRNWLNNEFYNTAFNSREQAKIKTNTVVNDNNPWYGTPGGNNTSDKLYFLSYAETMNTAYGFSSSTGTDTARMAQGTDFSKCNGLLVISYGGRKGNNWRVRSPGQYPLSAGVVYLDGEINGVETSTWYIVDTYVGNRPVFKINLNSEILTSTEGSGCIVDYWKGQIFGLAPGATSLAGYAIAADGYELSYIPTPSGFGTGTVANVTQAGEIMEIYTIIIDGDASGNGMISPIDALIALQSASSILLLDEQQMLASDVNGDGVVSAVDALMILQYSAGMITSFD